MRLRQEDYEFEASLAYIARNVRLEAWLKW
jgi:hypothetical protein